MAKEITIDIHNGITEQEVSDDLYPIPTPEEELTNTLSLLREKRNRLLAESDWTQSRDITLANDAAWQTYRQELRDLPASITTLEDVNNLVWPVKPE